MTSSAYLAYLARFDVEVGRLEVGAYGKYAGQLVRKLAPAEYLSKQTELDELEAHYREMVERGDTLNNAVVKLLRERRAELLQPDLDGGFDLIGS